VEITSSEKVTKRELTTRRSQIKKLFGLTYAFKVCAALVMDTLVFSIIKETSFHDKKPIFKSLKRFSRHGLLSNQNLQDLQKNC